MTTNDPQLPEIMRRNTFMMVMGVFTKQKSFPTRSDRSIMYATQSAHKTMKIVFGGERIYE